MEKRRRGGGDPASAVCNEKLLARELNIIRGVWALLAWRVLQRVRETRVGLDFTRRRFFLLFHYNAVEK